MKTQTALKKAGSKVALALLLGIERQSIQKWGDDVPKKREVQLRELRPQWFRSRS